MPEGRFQYADHGAGCPQPPPGLDAQVWDEHVVLAERGQRLTRLTPRLRDLAVERACWTEPHAVQRLADRKVHRQLAVDLAVAPRIFKEAISTTLCSCPRPLGG